MHCEKIITARKRSLGQGYIFTGVCDSVNRGSARETPLPGRETPLPGRPPPGRLPHPPPGRPPGRPLGNPSARDTPQETPLLPGRPPTRETPCQGDPPPGPHPGGKLRGIRSRSTAKGEIEGDQIQAHTQGGN